MTHPRLETPDAVVPGALEQFEHGHGWSFGSTDFAFLVSWLNGKAVGLR
jgi:hypothetical protein